MFPDDAAGLRKVVAILRITLGIIILATWVDNLTKGVYSAGGISGLFEIDRNIQLGTSYLREVMDRYDNNPVLASASYNAGPHRVHRWLPGEKSRTADSWVATIPYRETRKYVQRVLAYNAIYDWRLELPLTRLEERMPMVFTEDHYAQSGS